MTKKKRKLGASLAIISAPIAITGGLSLLSVGELQGLVLLLCAIGGFSLVGGVLLLYDRFQGGILASVGVLLYYIFYVFSLILYQNHPAPLILKIVGSYAWISPVLSALGGLVGLLVGPDNEKDEYIPLWLRDS